MSFESSSRQALVIGLARDLLSPRRRGLKRARMWLLGVAPGRE
jgi:hypothetical protein